MSRNTPDVFGLKKSNKNSPKKYVISAPWKPPADIFVYWLILYRKTLQREINFW